MSFDDAARQAADALGTEVGRLLQEQLHQFVTTVADAAARERTALTEQAQQAVTAAEQTLDSAVARARDEAVQDAETRLEAAFAERAAQAAAAADAARAEHETARRTHETERAAWEDRATRLEADLTERQERDADLVARAERAEAERLRSETEWQARAQQLEAQLAEQTAQAADAQALAAHAQAQAEAQAEAHAQALAEVEARGLIASAASAASAAGDTAVDFDETRESGAPRTNVLGFPVSAAAFGSPSASGGAIGVAVGAGSGADAGATSHIDFADDAARAAELARAQAAAAAAISAASSVALERLVSGFRALDEGQSLSQLLDTLAGQVAKNATRAAVFVVRGQARQGAVLQGWAFSGFSGAPLDARSLSVPLEKLPALADVVIQGGRSDVRTAGFAAADVNPLAFMSVPRTLTGVAVPVLVGGQVAAVVYGDDGGVTPGALASAQAADESLADEILADEILADETLTLASDPQGESADESQGGSANDSGSVSARATTTASAAPALTNWADALELLARHASRCLEAQTAIRAARLSSSAPPAPVVQSSSSSSSATAQAGTRADAGGSAVSGGALDAAGAAAASDDPASVAAREAAAAAEAYAEEHARRYARLLIADIRLYNEAAVRAGREHRDLWHRLQPDIARARRAFEDRVTDVADRERLFDEELVRTLADGDEALLGFDLMRPLPKSSSTERLAV